MNRARISALTLIVSLLFVASVSCTTEDPALSKTEFASEMAKAACSYLFSCCDPTELQDRVGGTGTEADCVMKLSASYSTLFQTAPEEGWNAENAAACVDQVREGSGTCERGYNVDSEMSGCDLVTATKGPGDSCETMWDCSTRFCRLGTCANPLAAGEPCSAEEPCKNTLRCINATCAELQPDGAACTIGEECYSGACGAGKCINSATYTCDGPA